ncbi:MAG: methyltransferase domain-containing protein [Candidatus Aminicenantaceae bacterium]
MKKLFIGLLYIPLLIFLSNAAVQEECLEVPYVPTPYDVVEEMLRMADVSKDDVLYDLGCGDGRIVIMAAEKMGTRGVGVDIDLQRIKESRENAIRAKVADRVRFLHQDLFEANISEATVVTLYLTSDVNLKVRPKLLRELKPGTRVVSNDFDMEEWEPDKTSEVTSDYESYTIYFWVVPANVTGTWEWIMPASSGKERYILQLDQQFQQVNGIVTVGATKMLIKDAKLRGDRLQFTMDQKVKGRIATMLFEGRVSSNSIEGSVELKSGPIAEKSKWVAKRDPSTVALLSMTRYRFN